MPNNAMLAFGDWRENRRGNRPRHWFNDPPRTPANANPTPTPAPAAAPTPTPAATLPLPSGVTLGPENQAFNAFYSTPLYQVPLQEGLEGLNSMWAARGQLESGAAEKSIADYAAGHAAGGMRDWISLLGNQQALGFNAASAQTGAAQTFANSITGANTNYADALNRLNSGYANAASNAYGGYAGGVSNAFGQLGNAQSQYAQNVGNINSNAIMANANNTNALIGGLGSAAGSIANYYAYKPYSGGAPVNLLAGTPYG